MTFGDGTQSESGLSQDERERLAGAPSYLLEQHLRKVAKGRKDHLEFLQDVLSRRTSSAASRLRKEVELELRRLTKPESPASANEVISGALIRKLEVLSNDQLNDYYHNKVYDSLPGLKLLREALASRTSSGAAFVLRSVESRIEELEILSFGQGWAQPIAPKVPAPLILAGSSSEPEERPAQVKKASPSSELSWSPAEPSANQSANHGRSEMPRFFGAENTTEVKAKPEMAKFQMSTQAGYRGLFGKPSHLIATVNQIVAKAKGHAGELVPNEVDLTAVLERFAAASWESERQRNKERSWLPFLIFHGSPPAAERLGLSRFLDEIGSTKRLGPLRDVIEQFFRYRHTKLTPILGEWIRERLCLVGAEKSRRDWVQHYRRHLSLFEERAVDYCCKLLPPNQPDFELWGDLLLPRTSWVYQDALALACYQSVVDRRDQALGLLYHYLQRGQTVQGETASRSYLEDIEPKSVQKAAIVQSLVAYARRGEQKPDTNLVAFALEKLGDPRTSDSLEWLSVSQEARGLLQYWLSVEDLELFFGQLADASDEKARAQYWKKYISSRLVRQSRIFLGANVIRRKESLVSRQLKSGRYGRLEGGQSDDVCAFVLRMEGCVVAEFSKTSNACYVYPESNFNPKFWSCKTATVSELKSRALGKALSHTHEWPQRFDDYLRRTYNIWISRF